MSCRICLEESGTFIHPCRCKGSAGYVHSDCLQKWIDESKSDKCEICKEVYLKEEHFGFNFPRFWKHFSSLKVKRPIRNTGYIIMGLSFINASTNILDYMVLASYLSSIFIFSGVVAILLHKEYVEALNAALLWKITFSIPYAIGILFFLIKVNTLHDYEYIINKWIYDLQMLFIVFTVRLLVFVWLFMRVLKFQNFTDVTEP